jgi:hypothetical protein
MTERLIIDSKTADHTVEFKRPLDLRGSRYVMALKDITLWNSWHNIKKEYNNHTFEYDDGKKIQTKTIPDGNYTVEDLNAYFKSADVDITISISYAVSRFTLEIGEGCAIYLGGSKFHELLGFEPGIHVNTVTGKYLANISRGVDVLEVHCDAIESSRYNDETSNILYSFTPTAPPGALIIEPIIEPIYLPVINTSELRRLRIWITDQNDQPIDVNGQMVRYTLLIKQQ